MVIVIIGVLSAFAVPRVADLYGNARKAAFQNLAQDLSSTANGVFYQSVTQGISPNGSFVYQGVNVTLINGYPSPNSMRSLVTMPDSSYFQLNAHTSYSEYLWQDRGGIGYKTCGVLYWMSASRGRYLVQIDDSGCSG